MQITIRKFLFRVKITIQWNYSEKYKVNDEFAHIAWELQEQIDHHVWKHKNFPHLFMFVIHLKGNIHNNNVIVPLKNVDFSISDFLHANVKWKNQRDFGNLSKRQD